MTQIPAMPPLIDKMNMTNMISVLDDVGKIYEAIKLADDEAGEAKRKRKMTVNSRQTK